MRQRYVIGFALMVVMLVSLACGSSEPRPEDSSPKYEDFVGEWGGILFTEGRKVGPMRVNVYADRTVELYYDGPESETPERKPIGSFENGVVALGRFEQDDRFVELHLTAGKLLVKSYTAQNEETGGWRTSRGGEETLKLSFEAERIGEAPVRIESEQSTAGTSNTLVTTVAVVVILLIVALGGGIFFFSTGASSNKRRHQRGRLGDVVEQAGKGLSGVFDQAGDKLNQMELGKLPTIEAIRLRRDETRLVAFLLTIIVLAILWYMTPSDALVYSNLLTIAAIAGAIQARRMYIKWLFYTLIGLLILTVVAPLSYAGIIGALKIDMRPFLLIILPISTAILFIYAEQYGLIHRLLNRGMPQSLRSRDTLSNWGKMIQGADGEGEAYWEIVIKHLEAVEAPHISWKHQVFSERVGLFTKKSKGIARKCLVVSSPSENYEILVGAWDYGSYLAIRQLIWMYKVKKPDYRLTSEDFLRDDVSSLFRTAVHGAVVGALQEFVDGADIKEHDIQEMIQAW